MQLSELTGDLPVERAAGAGDPQIAGVVHDSRRAAPGDLFVAWRGARHDGADFAAAAVARGAAAVVAATPPGPDGAPGGVPWLLAADPHALLAPLAARLYRHPDRELTMAAVTGTNGKSTVAILMAALFEAAGRPAGVLGSLGYRFGGEDLGGGRTTPEASDFFRVLARMRERGAAAAAMEVSSHALVLGRVEGAAFDVAVFTNLTRDHLDFHRDLEDYFAAKKRLFAMLKPGGRAVVGVDDPWGARLARELAAEGTRPLTFGGGGEVAITHAVLDAAGVRATVATARGELRIVSPLLGRYNLDNLLAAVAAAEALGLPHATTIAALATRGPLPGRMEPVAPQEASPLSVFVDYAHTPAALAAALGAARELTRGELIAVFGCGGDRDPGKRPEMGRIAGLLADLPIATTDNPRREDPLAILAAVEDGLKASGNPRYRIVPDRREAIRRAVAVAGPGAVVLIAGKGAETVQLVGDRELPFNDKDEAAQALAERYGQAIVG